MALSTSRIAVQGLTRHPHEVAAFEQVRAILPDAEPYLAWAFVELRAPDGRLYEVDALVLTRNCLFLIEMKSWHGKVRSDNQTDFVRTMPDGRSWIERNPYDLANLKAKVLGSMLERRMGARKPHVQALVLITESSGIELHGPASSCIVGPKRLADALLRGQFDGAPPWLTQRTVDKPLARDINAALNALGIARSQGAFKLGALELREVLEEGPGYQDRIGVHPTVAEMERRVRLYLVPQAASDASREQLRRAAEREARLLAVLGDHRFILKAPDYHPEGPQAGPCVVFERFVDGVPLDTFLRRNPNLALDARIDIITQVAEALAYCHGKSVFHRGLHPGAVLVRLNADGKVETRLYNFQLAAREGSASGTAHHTLHTARAAEIYRAPELLENPTIQNAETDVFSLGALAWFVLVGRAPAASLAERQRILDADDCLSLAPARDDLADGYRDGQGQGFQGLDDAISAATQAKPVNRVDSVQQWLHWLLDALTMPAAPADTTVEPLVARKGDELEGGFKVQEVLGTGSTARALLVERDGRHYALKVALDRECEDRLEAESRVLEQLVKRDNIVTLYDRPLIAGRYALLMTHAGQSLAQYLAKSGPPTLDLATRWGDDLLRALVTLEELGIQHRDIKPANIGTNDTAAKEARRLVLFDFSLSALPAERVTAGTPAYRDPFLLARERWDQAADRYAAALTLYEMLTGILPRYGQGNLSAIATDEAVTIEAERFDAAIREQLANFFAKALARRVEDRHPSAESMRNEWRRCMAGLDASTAHGDDQVQSDETVEQFHYAGLTADSPIDILPLTVRARSALDRSGAHTVRELLGLSRNRLAFIRGVGQDTRKAILRVIDLIEAARPELRGAEGEAFWPDWRGVDTTVALVPGLGQSAAAALEDADLRRVSQLARAPKSRVERLLRRFAGAEDAVRSYLRQAVPGAVPALAATLQDWIDLLLPPSAARRGDAALRTVRVLFGLEDVGGVYAENAEHAATLLGISRQAVYIALSQRKEAWLGIPHDDVLAAVKVTLEALGGAAPLAKVADALPDLIPHAPQTPADLATRCAVALVQFATAMADDFASTWKGNTRWLVPDTSCGAVVRELGKVADSLAARDMVAAPGVVQEALAAVVKNTPLAAAAPERLVRMAAWASDRAAASARLELYPRGLEAKRALQLCSGAVSARELKAQDLQSLVAVRYPEAAPLPGRQALDALVKRELGLHWDDAREVYAREQAPGETQNHTQLSTTFSSTTPGRRRPSGAVPAPMQTESQLRAAEFEQRLLVAMEQRSFKILRVSARASEPLIQALQARFALEPVPLDALLLRHARDFARAHQFDLSLVYEVDRVGRGHPRWADLVALMQQAAERALADLLDRRGMLLLTHPGLAARYGLDDLMVRLRAGVARHDGLGALLVVPSEHSHAGLVIDGRPHSMELEALPVHRLDVPTDWIRNNLPANLAA